jgi:hypothetical protein
MFYQSFLGPTRRYLIALAAAAALSSAPPPSYAQANQTWNVTITPTMLAAGTVILKYDIAPPQTAARLPCFTTLPTLPPDNSVLAVCPSDKVNWNVKSSKGNDQMILLFEDADVIWGPSYDIVHSIHAKNGQQAGGIIVDGSTGGTFEYAVFVFDQDTKQVFLDDPKIMTGGGGGPIGACYKLVRLLTQDQRVEKEVEDARQLCKSIKKLVLETPNSK